MTSSVTIAGVLVVFCYYRAFGRAMLFAGRIGPGEREDDGHLSYAIISMGRRFAAIFRGG